jgi:hypothetical protein
MEQDPQDALREILRRLEALDEKLEAIDERLSAVETPFEDADTVIAFQEEPPSAQLEMASGTAPSFQPENTVPRPPKIPLPPLPEFEEIAAASASAAVQKSTPPINAVEQPPAPARKFSDAVADFRPGNLPQRKSGESLEMRIATYYLPRVGLLFLALVCILFAREHARGPLGKVLVAYGVSLGLIIAGLWKEKKYPGWSRPVLAGGLAFSYFASYAMGFVEPMRLLDHLGVKLAVLAANLVLIFGVAHWKKSEVIGGTALVLGYLTTGVVGNDQAAFCSSLALSVAALLFLWLNQWFVATAVSAAATYIAHFYVWRALPEADVRTAAENFWFHFMFLSLYFLVFTAAALAGKRAAMAELELDEGFTKRPLNAASRRDLLTILTQTNVAAYIAGMVTVLKLTQVYWHQAWMLFFPLAAVCAGFGLLFAGLNAVQTVYLIAGTFCLSLGVVSLASPMWLPIFLAVQALVMLWRAKGRYALLWRWLGLGVLAYAAGYLVSGGLVDVLQLSTARVTAFPWWTFAGVTAIMLVFAARWEQ